MSYVERQEGLHLPPDALPRSEVLLSRKEVRFGDPHTDAAELARLFVQPSTIEHLAGIFPPGADIIKDRKRYQQVGFLEASEEEIKAFYLARPHLALLVLDGDQGDMAGSVTVEAGGLGIHFATLQRLVVNEAYRGRDYGRELLRSAHALIFNRTLAEGLRCSQARAAVILRISGDHFPQRLFREEGYISGAETSTNTCVSWSPQFRRFRAHNALPMNLDRGKYMRHHWRDVNKDFPKRVPSISPTLTA